jgi:hypothetical protein
MPLMGTREIRRINMAIDVPVRESVEIQEGKHKGTITKIAVRPEPYEYLDIYIELDDVKDTKGNPVSVKEGMPLGISLRSKLGKTLIKFGCEESLIEEKAKAGESIDVEPYFKNKKVVLMTTNESTERGTFARVVAGSLKPA